MDLWDNVPEQKVMSLGTTHKQCDEPLLLLDSSVGMAESTEKENQNKSWFHDSEITFLLRNYFQMRQSSEIQAHRADLDGSHWYHNWNLGLPTLYSNSISEGTQHPAAVDSCHQPYSVILNTKCPGERACTINKLLNSNLGWGGALNLKSQEYMFKNKRLGKVTRSINQENLNYHDSNFNISFLKEIKASCSV